MNADRAITVGFAGMTHLGVNSSAAVAEKGFRTVCFDPSGPLIDGLARQQTDIVEPDLSDLLVNNRSRLIYTADVADLRQCNIVYISTDVPTDDNGVSDLSPIHALVDTIAPVLVDEQILVILCQVPPGFTRSLGRAPHSTYYQVETLIFGRAVERALYPERYIVGCADPAEPLPEAFRTVLESFGCPILPMLYESAEITKIAINMCLVAQVSAANTLAEICEHIGADWSEVIPALRLDKRIGEFAYLMPGLGIAGGNLERDLATLVRIGEAKGTDVGVVKSFQANSRHRRDWALRVLEREVLAENPGATVAVLGLAYKADTASVKNSPSLSLLRAIPQVRVKAFDPVVQPQSEWHPRLIEADSPLDACDGADALVVMTPWRVFAEIDPAKISGAMSGRAVIDPYRVFDDEAVEQAGLAYYRLGTSPHE